MGAMKAIQPITDTDHFTDFDTRLLMELTAKAESSDSGFAQSVFYGEDDQPVHIYFTVESYSGDRVVTHIDLTVKPVQTHLGHVVEAEMDDAAFYRAKTREAAAEQWPWATDEQLEEVTDIMIKSFNDSLILPDDAVDEYFQGVSNTVEKIRAVVGLDPEVEASLRSLHD